MFERTAKGRFKIYFIHFNKLRQINQGSTNGKHDGSGSWHCRCTINKNRTTCK